MRFLIIKTGSTYPEIANIRGDFEHWISAPLPLTMQQHVQIIHAFEGEMLPPPETVDGIIITGSGAMVSDREAWSEGIAEWLRQSLPYAIPMLGICYGHQLIAHALGGTVDYNPHGYEVGSIRVNLTENAKDDALFAQLPAELPTFAIHLQAALNLPAHAVCLAKNAKTDYQAYRINHHIWGVQFHPEFDADIMLRYLEMREEIVLAQGFDIQDLRAQIHNAARPNNCYGKQLLNRFGEIVQTNYLMKNALNES